MKLRYKLILIIFFCVIVLALMFIQFLPSNDIDATVIFHTEKGKFNVQCQIADDDLARRLGLSTVDYLKQNQGMLFIYEYPKPLVFTMKNMNISLDIIFIDKDKKVINIVEANIGEEDIKSNGSAQYVVEINQGLAEKNHIVVGSVVEI